MNYIQTNLFNFLIYFLPYFVISLLTFYVFYDIIFIVDLSKNVKKGGHVIMKSTGIVRRVDELGRVVLPIELRNKFGITEKDPMEIYVDGSSIILKKLQKIEIKIKMKYINIF